MNYEKLLHKSDMTYGSMRHPWPAIGLVLEFTAMAYQNDPIFVKLSNHATFNTLSFSEKL